MRKRMNAPYLVELPTGIPYLAGHYGTMAHTGGRDRFLLVFPDWDLLYVDRGQIEFQLRNQKSVRVLPGEFLLLPPSVPMWWECRKPARLCFCHFSFHPLPEKLFPSVRRDCMEREKIPLIPWIFSRRQAAAVWRAYRDIINLKFHDSQPWRSASALTTLISELGAFAHKLDLQAHDGSPLSSSEALDPRVIDVCRRIGRNPCHPWKVSELAKSHGITTGHLDRLFRSNLQRRLKGFIVERRLQRALSLLDERKVGDNKSIKAISVKCGFSSQHFFSRQFKSFYGVPPSKADRAARRPSLGRESVYPEVPAIVTSR